MRHLPEQFRRVTINPVPRMETSIESQEWQILATATTRLLSFTWQLSLQTQAKTQSDLFEAWSQIQRVRNREKDQEKEKIVRELAQGNPALLKAKLKDRDPLIQLTAIQVVHNRRVHLERELIGCLSHPQSAIRQATRQALVRLARGVDFGPRPNSGPVERREAGRRWENWLALQGDRGDMSDSLPIDPVDVDATRWATELAQAGKTQENEVLERLREAPEPAGTLSLARAIPDLKGPRQAKARQALTQRLSTQDGTLWKARFVDEDAGIRRAVLAAVAAKKASIFIEDVLLRLEDSDPSVADAAQVTLKVLSNQDFGPAANAAPLDRAIAIGRWYQWWINQRKQIAASLERQRPE